MIHLRSDPIDKKILLQASAEKLCEVQKAKYAYLSTRATSPQVLTQNIGVCLIICATLILIGLPFLFKVERCIKYQIAVNSHMEVINNQLVSPENASKLIDLKVQTDTREHCMTWIGYIDNKDLKDKERAKLVEYGTITPQVSNQVSNKWEWHPPELPGLVK